MLVLHRSRASNSTQIDPSMADATAMVTTMAVTTLDPVKGMREIGEYVWQQARAAIEARGVFVIAVSGGSLPAVRAVGAVAKSRA